MVVVIFLGVDMDRQIVVAMRRTFIMVGDERVDGGGEAARHEEQDDQRNCARHRSHSPGIAPGILSFIHPERGAQGRRPLSRSKAVVDSRSRRPPGAAAPEARMTGVTSYCLQDFIIDLERLTSQDRDPEQMVRGISRKIRLLIDGDRFLTREECEPDPSGYASHAVYCDRQRRFVVKSGVWQPGHGTPIHDHGTWGVMGVVTGDLKVSTYERLDDRRRTGHARLRKSAEIVADPGSVSCVLPPDREIHKVECLSRPALSIHVYGRDIDECNMYDLETETCRLYEQGHENAGKVR